MKVNGIIARIAAVAVLSISALVASCGGGSVASDMDAQLDQNSQASNIIDEISVADDINAQADIDKGTSGYDGYWVESADAAYVDGLDILFQFKKNGMGQYKFVIYITNNSAHSRIVDFKDFSLNYDYFVYQNGVKKWQASQDSFCLVIEPDFYLPPYQTKSYEVPWDGKDLSNHVVSGLATVKGKLYLNSGTVLLEGPAYI